MRFKIYYPLNFFGSYLGRVCRKIYWKTANLWERTASGLEPVLNCLLKTGYQHKNKLIMLSKSLQHHNIFLAVLRQSNVINYRATCVGCWSGGEPFVTQYQIWLLGIWTPDLPHKRRVGKGATRGGFSPSLAKLELRKNIRSFNF